MLPNILLYLLPLPFLIIASWQDIKERSVTITILAGVLLAGLVSFAITSTPLSSLYSHVLFSAVFLLLGIVLQETKAWFEADTALIGIIAFIVPPIDYFMFAMVFVSMMVAFCIPLALKKVKTFMCIPALSLTWLIYILVI